MTVLVELVMSVRGAADPKQYLRRVCEKYDATLNT